MLTFGWLAFNRKYRSGEFEGGEVRRRIWSQTMAAREETGNPIFDEFLRRSLSKFIALHTRWAGVQKEFNISTVVWVALYVIIASR